MRARLKILALAAVFLLLLPAQWLALRLGSRHAGVIPMLFHRAALRMLNVRVAESGAPPADGPLLILANHLSWIDICVIGARRPVIFIARADMGSWPIFGWLARLQHTVFVDRTRRMATADAALAIHRRLAARAALVLFAEGTTNDGRRILPFRSALVGAAQAASADTQADAVPLQALTVAYVRQGGLPLARSDLPALAWYGDMDLVPHLMARLAGAQVVARLHWGATYRIGSDGDRKVVTQAIEQEVRATYGGFRRGRSSS